MDPDESSVMSEVSDINTAMCPGKLRLRNRRRAPARLPGLPSPSRSRHGAAERGGDGRHGPDAYAYGAGAAGTWRADPDPDPRAVERPRPRVGGWAARSERSGDLSGAQSCATEWEPGMLASACHSFPGA